MMNEDRERFGCDMCFATVDILSDVALSKLSVSSGYGVGMNEKQKENVTIRVCEKCKIRYVDKKR